MHGSFNSLSAPGLCTWHPPLPQRLSVRDAPSSGAAVELEGAPAATTSASQCASAMPPAFHETPGSPYSQRRRSARAPPIAPQLDDDNALCPNDPAMAKKARQRISYGE